MQSPRNLSASEPVRRVPQSTIDLLEIFLRRWYFVAGCLLLAVLLGVVFCRVAEPIYESSADVLVVHKRPQAVTGDNQYESGFQDYLDTHLALIVSPVIVQRAIANSNLASLESFAGFDYSEQELVDVIIQDLEVEGGSRDLGESADSIMTLAYRSYIAEDAPVVVQALLDSYESFHQEVYRGMSDDTVELIAEARDLLENDLASREESYIRFRQASPLVASGTEEVNPLQDRLSAIELRRSELLLRKTEVESQLQALEQATASGASERELLDRVTEMRQQNTTRDGLSNASTVLENQLVQLIDDEQGLLEHYGPNHPHVLTMRQRISDTRRLFALPTTAHSAEPESAEESAPSGTDRGPVKVYVNYLRQELESLKISERRLSDLYDREHDMAKEHSADQLKDNSFRRGIDRTEQLYDVVINRLQEASLVKGFGGFETTVIAPPRLGTKVSPQSKIVLPVSAFGGVLLGCMLAMLFEFRDQTFHSSDQIQQQLGLSVVGQIPQYRAEPDPVGDAAGRLVDGRFDVDPMVCAYHGPRSLPAEAFRALRTALNLDRPAESIRVLQVTGADFDDGSSTVAANLAVCLAQTGKRVLLVDANLRDPQQSRLFGLASPESGLAAVITSETEPMDAICSTAVENLSLLPVGALPTGPRELFTSPRFAELLHWVRDNFDHVLIDTEPLQVASDPLVIASHVDGILLTLRLGKDRRQQARGAKQMLNHLDAEVLGVVVNQVRGSLLQPRLFVSHDQSARREMSGIREEQRVG